MIDNFAGKTAVLTGAGSGFGLECARIGARLGMNLVLVDVQQDALDAAAAEMQAAGIVGTGGAVQMQQSLANAAAQTAAGGRFSLGSFLMHLMADPLFWITVTTVALAVYMAIKRRKRFHIFGV